MAAVHYRRTSRATFIQDVLVEIASVFAPSRYKFIRSLSATERSIRRSINVVSPRPRDDSNRRPSPPPLPAFAPFSPPSPLPELLISSTPTNRNCSLFAEREPCPYTIRSGTISLEGGEIGIGILWG